MARYVTRVYRIWYYDTEPRSYVTKSRSKFEKKIEALERANIEYEFMTEREFED